MKGRNSEGYTVSSLLDEGKEWWLAALKGIHCNEHANVHSQESVSICNRLYNICTSVRPLSHLNFLRSQSLTFLDGMRKGVDVPRLEAFN